MGTVGLAESSHLSSECSRLASMEVSVSRHHPVVVTGLFTSCPRQPYVHMCFLFPKGLRSTCSMHSIAFYVFSRPSISLNNGVSVGSGVHQQRAPQILGKHSVTFQTLGAPWLGVNTKAAASQPCKFGKFTQWPCASVSLSGKRKGSC